MTWIIYQHKKALHSISFCAWNQYLHGTFLFFCIALKQNQKGEEKGKQLCEFLVKQNVSEFFVAQLESKAFF